MSKIEKIKRIILVSIGFGLATYLIMSGVAILNQSSDTNTTSKVHDDIGK